VGLESSVTKIEDLNESWPLSTDERRQGDDHLRNIKAALKSLLSDLNQIKIGPADLSGQAGKALVVNTAEDGFDELESFQTAADAASHAADASAHHTKYTDAEATAQAKAIVQDSPVDGVTDQPISSNWAYDHEADANVHHTPPAVFVDRGDPSSPDFTETDLTFDGAWHDLDLSSVVPAGAKAVLLRVKIRDDVANTTLRFRKNGNSNTLNVSVIMQHVAGQYNWEDLVVACDANRVIEYMSPSSLLNVFITVGGWWI